MTPPKNAFITGAGSGIGRAVASHLAERGTRVALFDRSADGLAETASAIGADRPLLIEGDVAREEDVAAAVQEATTQFGQLDAAVSCAGIEVMGLVPEMEIDDWHRVIAVNLTGTFLTARHTIPALESAGGGSFVAISSDAGVQGASGFGAYCASKHGVIGLVRSLALDHGPAGVRSNAVCPGFVETPMADRIFADTDPEERHRWEQTVPLGRFARPDEVAAVVAHLTSDEARYTNGLVYSIDGGSTAGYFEV